MNSGTQAGHRRARTSCISMDLLVVDTLEADVIEWLGLRHSIRHRPRARLRAARVPPLPLQRPGGDRSGLGDDRRRDAAISRRCCARSAGSASAPRTSTSPPASGGRSRSCAATPPSARAEAEFTIGAALSLLRRVPVRNADGSVAGRELGGATDRPGRHVADGALDRPAALRLRRPGHRLRPGAACQRERLGRSGRSRRWACASCSSGPTSSASSSPTSAATTACSATAS